MKKILLATTAITLAAMGTAFAADLPVRGPVYTKAPPPAPIYDWSGFYIGVAGGGAWQRVDGSFVNPPPATWSTNPSTAVVTGFVGVQGQFGPGIVLGIEGDFHGLLNNDGGTDGCHPAVSCFPGTTLNGRLRDGIWTVGGRAGWAFTSWLPYVTGGFAATRVNETLTTPPGGILSESTRTSHNGFYIGGGVDWKLWQNVVLGVEYRHFEFNSVTATPVVAATGALNAVDTWAIKPRADMVQARLSYLFNWGPWR